MKQESKASIARRVAEVTGFYIRRIVLLEASYEDGWCTGVSFSVNGKGCATDFRDWWLAPEYDDEEEG